MFFQEQTGQIIGPVPVQFPGSVFHQFRDFVILRADLRIQIQFQQLIGIEHVPRSVLSDTYRFFKDIHGSVQITDRFFLLNHARKGSPGSRFCIPFFRFFKFTLDLIHHAQIIHD